MPTPVDLTDSDKALLAKADTLYAICREAMDTQAIKSWLDAVWDVVAEGDRYFAGEKPFDKALSAERKGTILYVTAEAVRQMAILVQPVMPASAGKLLDLLALNGPAERTFATLGPTGRLRPGTQLPEPQASSSALRRSGCRNEKERLHVGRRTGSRQGRQEGQEGSQPPEIEERRRLTCCSSITPLPHRPPRVQSRPRRCRRARACRRRRSSWSTSPPASPSSIT